MTIGSPAVVKPALSSGWLRRRAAGEAREVAGTAKPRAGGQFLRRSGSSWTRAGAGGARALQDSIVDVTSHLLFCLDVCLAGLDFSLQILCVFYAMAYQVVLYCLYLALMIFCLLTGLTHKLEKTERMVRAKQLEVEASQNRKRAEILSSLLTSTPNASCLSRGSPAVRPAPSTAVSCRAELFSLPVPAAAAAAPLRSLSFATELSVSRTKLLRRSLSSTFPGSDLTSLPRDSVAGGGSVVQLSSPSIQAPRQTAGDCLSPLGSAGLTSHVSAGLTSHVPSGLTSHVPAGLTSHVPAAPTSHVSAGSTSHVTGLGICGPCLCFEPKTEGDSLAESNSCDELSEEDNCDSGFITEEEEEEEEEDGEVEEDEEKAEEKEVMEKAEEEEELVVEEVKEGVVEDWEKQVEMEEQWEELENVELCKPHL